MVKNFFILLSAAILILLAAGAKFGIFSAQKRGEIYGQIGIYYQKKGEILDAKSWFLRSCENGFWAGCFNLGVMYLKSGEVAKAVPYYERACFGEIPQGCVAAAGFYHLSGKFQNALELAIKGCELEAPRSCYIAASIYAGGKGRAPDSKKAEILYQKSCLLGYKASCLELANLKNFQNLQLDSYEISRLKSECNEYKTDSCVKLGDLYYSGESLPKDTKAAAVSFKKACDFGDIRGCASLGAMYYEGDGVDRNATMAKALLEKSCNAGNETACHFIKTMGELRKTGIFE